MLIALCVASWLAADDARFIDTSAIAGMGVGFSPNSTTAYAMPTIAVNVDFVVDGWYAGGGVEALTFVDPHFFPQEGILRALAVDLVVRAGHVFIDDEVFRVRADLGGLVGISEGAVEDGPQDILYLVPSLGVAGTFRGESHFRAEAAPPSSSRTSSRTSASSRSRRSFSSVLDGASSVVNVDARTRASDDRPADVS